MSLHKIIKESIDDFDWIKDIESSIDIDNLSGYYFTWEDDHLNRKFYIKDYIGEFEVQIHWVHDGEDLYNILDKVRLLSHIKNGNYKLYDKNEEPVNPDKLVWLDDPSNSDLEIDESLEWSDKDVPFDEKDKSFEEDPNWSKDKDWELNPERSYWKQGDAGGSGGGDVNESDDLSWIKDVSKKLPKVEEREKISLEDFLYDFMVSENKFVKDLWDYDIINPSEEFKRRYIDTESTTDSILDDWFKGGWKDKKNISWDYDDGIPFEDIFELLSRGSNSWDYIERKSIETQQYGDQWADALIFERESDNRYFALRVNGNDYDGTANTNDYLYEVFPRKKIVFEVNSIEKIVKESEWEWAKEIPGTKEYGEEYRYFEVVACYALDYETEECEDWYPHFVKIPKYEANEIWDRWVGYFGGPGDEALGVIEYVIEKQLISPRELEEIVAFEGVREIDEMDFKKHFKESKRINESDWGWIKDVGDIVITKVEDLVEGNYYTINQMDQSFLTTVAGCMYETEAELFEKLFHEEEEIVVKVTEEPRLGRLSTVFCDNEETWSDESGWIVGLDFYSSSITKNNNPEFIPWFNFYITNGMLTFITKNI
jgi:hypothetical protein